MALDFLFVQTYQSSYQHRLRRIREKYDFNQQNPMALMVRF
jgi:hypothetical protein